MPSILSQDLRLVGQHAGLEPLQAEHGPELAAAAADGKLWDLHFTGVPSPAGVAAYMATAVQNREAGKQQPFVVRRLSDQRIVGCTRYYDIEHEHRNLAIGYTWYGKSAQRTAINTECKLLLLAYAFEQLDCIGVAFHTDHENVISQAAIARLGARHDGVLRNHRIMPDGRIRHTWCFSIIDTEWPRVKAGLVARLAQD